MRLLDGLLQGCDGPKDILGNNGLPGQLSKRLLERALEAEMSAHLGYEPHAPEGWGTGNVRNGKGRKTVQTESGELEIEVPRDRNGSFEPEIVRKRQRRLEGFDDKVLALYARGQSTREIQGVLEDLEAWQARPLSAVYPILYFDALVVKSREDGSVKNRSVYLALGINLEGEKELLGMWMAETEGSKFWLRVFTELKNRGAFPNDQSIRKVFFMALDHLSKKWTKPVENWKAALNKLFAYTATGSRMKPTVTDNVGTIAQALTTNH
jgi:putative transposase